MTKDTPPSESESEHKTVSVDLTTGKQSDIPVEAEQAEPVEQSKKSRVSAKIFESLEFLAILADEIFEICRFPSDRTRI